jgi:hypothetical protein
MDDPSASLPVSRNCRVTVELVDSSGACERAQFTLVTSRQADLRAGLLDEDTPLGRALLGQEPGAHIPYRIGDLVEVRLLSVEPLSDFISPQAAQERRDSVRRAEAQSEITSQMIFATASGSKWGDYDVDVEKLMGGETEGEPKQPEKKNHPSGTE